MPQQISKVYDYLLEAYRQDFGLDPTGNKEICRRLEQAALDAMAQYRGRIIEDRPVEIFVPFAHVVDVLRPQPLKRTLSYEEFSLLIADK